jgi:hypothetical protein
MHIATDQPDAQWNGERVIVIIPSGRDTIEIALSLHHAMTLAHATQRQANEAMREDLLERPVPACAQIVAFPDGVPSLARREREVTETIRAYPDAFTKARR